MSRREEKYPYETRVTELAAPQASPCVRSHLTYRLAPLLYRGEYAAACEQIYRELFARIYRYICARVQSRDRGEDLVQEVFLAAFQALPRFDPCRASLETWIYAICSNKLKKYYRDDREHCSLDDENLAWEPASEDDLEAAFCLQEARDQLADLISRLSALDRQLVIMRYFEEASSEEMAAATGLSPANVRVRLCRALKKMEEMSKE